MKIRLPRPLKARLDAEVAKNGRTLTSEIVRRLERTFVEDDERAGTRFADNGDTGFSLLKVADATYGELIDRIEKLEKDVMQLKAKA